MADSLQSIVFIIPWFGSWPAWFELFLESCRWNPTVDWLIYSDAPPPGDVPPNVTIITISAEDYRALAAGQLGLRPQWTDHYKLCDLKPALGYIHDLQVAGYDFWGFGDLDVIYGDLRQFLTPEVLSHDLVSTHNHIVSGHFALVRNSHRMTRAFMRIPGWRRLLTTADHKSFDEQVFSSLFLPIRGRRKWRRLFMPHMGGGYFEEQYSTNISSFLKWVDGGETFPERWFWNRGHLTTDRSGDREFLYLHFSHWQSNRWTDHAVAPWKKLDRLVRLPAKRPTGFTISAEGFTPLPEMAVTSVAI